MNKFELGRVATKRPKQIFYLFNLAALSLTLNSTSLYALNHETSTAQITITSGLTTVRDVFRQIENNSDYVIFYNDKTINVDRKVDLTAKTESVNKVLDKLFLNTDNAYIINEKQIIIVRSEKNKDSFSVPEGKQKVSGVLTDANGEAIIGATVIVKGTTIGVLTDIDGRYEIEVPAGSVLEYSFLGYNTEERKVKKGEAAVNVRMLEASVGLDEVVVVGFGAQKKANLTGAVTTVKMEDALGNRPLAKASDALQGVVPGLYVGNNGNQPGGSKSFQIRGAYTIGGGEGKMIAPLVLIDNVEGSIDLLNPEDIESITVLKDAASSAIYGARAAGGVILVTTKRPKNGAKFQLNYNNNFAFGNSINLPKHAPLVNYLDAYNDAEGDQFWSMGSPSVSKWKEYLGMYQNDPSSLDIKGDGIYKDETGAVYYLSEKDLVKNMLETSFQQTHNLSLSGGSDKLRFRLSTGLVNNNGVLITDKDKFDRMNITGYIAADVTNWYTQEATLSYAHSNQSLPSSALGAIYSTRLASFYPEGNMPEGISTPESDNLPFFTPANQIRWSNASTSINDNPRIFLKSLFKPVKNLEVAFEYTYDKNIYDYHWYTGKVAYTTIQGGKDFTPSNDYLRKQRNFTGYNAINVYSTYSLSVKELHNFKAMVGYNQEAKSTEGLDVLSYGQAVIEVPSLGAGTASLTAKDSYSEFSTRSGFFRLNYNYDNRYLLEANGRYDGSSKFPKSSRFGFFPSVSVGWNIAQERFMAKTNSWLDALKLRGSYGMIGNQNISPYMFIPTMTINNKYNGWIANGDYVTAITSLPSLVSTTFTWERVHSLNIGVDFTLFNNRLNGSGEWYRKDTKGMLAPGMQLPAVVGTDAPYQNTADMRTKGWEVSLNWRDEIGKVGYRIGFNLSDYQNTISKYENNESKLLSSFYTGQRLGDIWGYVYDGFYSVDDFEDTKSWKLKEGVTSINGTNPRPGDVKFLNLRDDDKGDNLIYAGNNTYDNPGDRKVIGNNTPRYLYGITLGASYAGFDLNIFMQGTGKRDAWIANNIMFPLYGDYKFVSLYEGLENYWRPTDADNGDYSAAMPNAEFPRIYGNYANSGSNYRTSDRYLSDASYLRIKNVSLSYTLPKAISQKFFLNQIRAFANVENLATFTPLRKGIDPETLSWNYPAFRTFSFGLNISL